MAHLLDRRGLIKLGGASLAAPYLWLPARAKEAPWVTQTVAPFVEVEIASGKIKGGHSRGALAFKGIPYAGSVSGKNRFKAPPPIAPWTGVRDATRLGPPALQSPGTTYGEHEPAYAEECLVLNVWTPAIKDGGKRPVMFYCHGGGFSSGSGGQNIQDGAHLAAAYDVVVVAINHRLGLLGFLYLGEVGGADYATSGNQGILDIVAALQWVKTNISVFGGDPSNVMVFGESGGGFKTCSLLAMPAAQGLIHKAGVQSGAMRKAMPKEVASETAARVLAGLGISDVSKLADVPAERLLAIQLQGAKGPLGTATKAWEAEHPSVPGAPPRDGGPGEWGTVLDGTVLPRHPFSPDATPLAANIPLLIGHAKDEATFNMRDNPAFFKIDEAGLVAMGKPYLGDRIEQILALYKKTRPRASVPELGIAIMTAMGLGTNTITIADLKSHQGAPVYRYRYDYQSNVPIKGTDWTLRAGHASDISVFFLNYEILDLQGNGPGLAETSKAMSSYFASFARNAVPVAEGQPAWPRYDTESRATMLINARCEAVNDPDSEERQFWQSFGDL